MSDAAMIARGFTAKNSLGYLMRHGFRLMTQRAEKVFEGQALNLSQWIALRFIAEGRAKTAVEIARFLGHNTGATTRMIDQLESQGLIRRDRNGTDRRTITLTLTPEGGTMFLTFQAMLDDIFEDAVAGFSPAEVEALVGLLGRVVSNLEASDSS